ncbi:quinol oxidase [Zobellella endophytica]|uniref:Quinol oxidase n=1 Tax=Zobellella endophytica TaxID=2116700 RepID=A0A2P7RB95_9GAMM|nr:quinol oxidase [Zobellella endophytica]PSJ47450.1 quinol oxidase [Zobellella endophytica]
MNGRWQGVLVLLAALGPAWAEPMPARLDADGVQRVEVVGGNYFFRPDHIVVKVGVPVELMVSKEPGLTPHSLVIWSPRMGIDVDAMLGGSSRVIRFTPTVTGRVDFYCQEKLLFFASHQERGMAGVLEVVE